ncbi:hypothetical protein D3C76_1408470 [compost metagenome]
MIINIFIDVFTAKVASSVCKEIMGITDLMPIEGEHEELPHFMNANVPRTAMLILRHTYCFAKQIKARVDLLGLTFAAWNFKAGAE